MEPRLELKTEAFQAILDETAKVDPRIKKSSRKTSTTGATLTGWRKADSSTNSRRENNSTANQHASPTVLFDAVRATPAGECNEFCCIRHRPGPMWRVTSRL
jgi:hypothetical protein